MRKKFVSTWEVKAGTSPSRSHHGHEQGEINTFILTHPLARSLVLSQIFLFIFIIINIPLFIQFNNTEKMAFRTRHFDNMSDTSQT